MVKQEQLHATAGAIRLCVLQPAGGVPVLPAARALGACGGPATLSTTERAILAPTAALATCAILLVEDPADSDVLMHPHDALLHPGTVGHSVATAKRFRRGIAMFSSSDAVHPSPAGWGVTWRTSGYASRLLPHERVCSGEVPDLYRERSTSTAIIRPWKPRPSLGFIGHVTSGLASFGYLRHGWQHWYGFTLRERVLREFERSGTIDARFVRRSRNLGPPGIGVENDLERKRMRQEYVDSVFDTDYSLCVRGAGNWSFRFFEALSAGRIPILIDTDSVLPEESSIPWERHICRIPIRKLREAPSILAEFHERIGPSGFQQMQEDNRELWTEHLAPAPFLLHALKQTLALKESSGSR